MFREAAPRARDEEFDADAPSEFLLGLKDRPRKRGNGRGVDKKRILDLRRYFFFSERS